MSTMNSPDLSSGLCHGTITTRAEALRRDPVIFPHDSSSGVVKQHKLAEQAADFCWGCSVISPCLSYALETGAVGTWGRHDHPPAHQPPPPYPTPPPTGAGPMTRKPIVHATYEREAVDISTIGDPARWNEPGIQLTLTFRLHGHEAALRLLDAAVADIRAQIEETR